MRLSFAARMKAVHLIVGVLCIGLMTAATLWGAWCWYRVRSSRLFWQLLRTGQAVVVLEVALGGLLVALGKQESSLHLIYGLLPLAVSFFAEQLRIASAQAVLDVRGLESSAAVGELAPDEQRQVVVAILQRELGVMVLAGVVIVALLARAAGTAG
jgi:hypothetical protein